MSITKQISVGKVKIGGGASVSIQSMTNTITEDTVSTISQILSLAEAGCEIIRVAVPDRKTVDVLPEIIDPQTGEPLGPGETGELVLTTLTREA